MARINPSLIPGPDVEVLDELFGQMLRGVAGENQGNAAFIVHATANVAANIKGEAGWTAVMVA